MTSLHIDQQSAPEVCNRIKHLGFAASHHVRLYGEEFEVVSDPFPAAGGIAVHVRTRKSPTVRVLQLPATILQSAQGPRPHGVRRPGNISAA